MSSLSFGTLSVNILKAKNLIKIENGTKKSLTIKNPIIKIDYISGIKVSTPAEKQGDEFVWNCKLNFEAIKDKTSFFLQCFNNNTEDNYNLLGETRIPLILAIENEKFKQWYPIYLKEKKRQKSNFICRGEILMDIEFFSAEKIKNDNLDIPSLLLDDSIQNDKSNTKLTGFSIVTSEDASKIPRQPPKILPRSVRNMGYRNHGIRKYKKEEENEANDVLFEDMEKDDPIYNDSYFHEKYNDNYTITPNDVTDQANQSFTYSTFMKNKQQQKLSSSNSIKMLKRSNSINDSKLERKKLIHHNSLPIFKDLDKGLHYRSGSLPRRQITPIQALSTPPTTVFNTSSLRFYKSNPSIESDYNTIITNSDNTNQSVPLSDNPNYEWKGVSKTCLSNSTGNYSVINSIDENNYNSILRSSSNSSEFNLFGKSSVPSDNDLLTFQNISVSPSIVPTKNGIKEPSILTNTSQNISLNQKNSISLNELTSEEKDFILKMNAKYKKNMIVIDDSKNNVIDSSIPSSTSTSTPTPTPTPTPTLTPTPIPIPITNITNSSSSSSFIEYIRPKKKRAKKIFKNLFNTKGKKKHIKKEIDNNNKIKTTLKKEKSVVSMKDTTTGKIYTTTTTTVTTVTRSPSNSTIQKLRRKGSNISRKSLQRLDKSMEKNKERIKISNNESRQPFTNITNSGGLKRKNAVRYSKRYSSSFALPNTYPSFPIINSNDDNSNEMNDSSSTINGIIEPYHHMNTSNIMENTDNLKKENIENNNKIENKENNIPSHSFIPIRRDSTSNKFMIFNNDVIDIPINNENMKPKEIQWNDSTTVKTNMIMYDEPHSLSNISNEREIKMDMEPSEHKSETVTQIIDDKNSQHDQQKGKKPKVMDIDSIQPESTLNPTTEEIENDMKEKTLSQSFNNNENTIIEQNCSTTHENLNQEVIDMPDQSQHYKVTPELMEIMKEPLLTSKQGMSEQELQNYSNHMIQKLQYHQLSQRISLSFRHYRQYQYLLQQFNENKQPYDQLSKMKEQLYRKQQNEMHVQNENHAQQRTELQQYLFYLK